MGSQSLATAMVGRLIGIGAAYVGLNAGVVAFRSLSNSAVNYTSELESTRIGLQAVLQAVKGGTWEEAGETAIGVFEKLKTAAMISPATTAEMFSIYQGIVGPVAAAGFELDKVHQLTVDTTLAASALHVDFAQASRDVSAMVRGAAGLDVKLFSTLRSTNAIQKSAEQWNKMSQKERVEQLATALAKYRSAGEAFGRSWKGVTSTFQDVKNEALRAFTTPVLTRLATKLGALNDYFMANQESISRRLQVYGERFGDALVRAWDMGERAARYVVSHWGEITRRIGDAMTMVQGFAPQLLQAAKIYAGISIGSNVAGKALVASAGAASLANSGLGIAGWLGKALGFGAAGTTGATAVAAGATAATASAAGAAEAGTVAGLASTSGAAAAAGAALPAVAIGLAAIAVTAPVLANEWDLALSAMRGIAGDVWTQMVELAQTAWQVIKPVAMILGQTVLVLAGTIGTMLVAGFRALINAAQWTLDEIRPFSDWLTGELVPAIHKMWVEFEKFANVVGVALDKNITNQASMALMEKSKYSEWQETPTQMVAILNGANAIKAIDKAKKQTKQTVSVTNDFKGSRITVNQKFEGDQDPDRIVMAMMSDLTRQSELRLSTGYASAFTR